MNRVHQDKVGSIVIVAVKTAHTLAMNNLICRDIKKRQMISQETSIHQDLGHSSQPMRSCVFSPQGECLTHVFTTIIFITYISFSYLCISPSSFYFYLSLRLGLPRWHNGKEPAC